MSAAVASLRPQTARHLTRLATTIVIAVNALIPVPAGADPSPAVARGFSSEKAFEIGDIDAINPFNFNAVLTIPVGPEYRLSEHLTYRFWISHNGNLWDYKNRGEAAPCPMPSGCRIFTQAWPAAYSNAGLGWMVSLFGRLFPPGSSGNEDGSPYWKYTSADGAEHFFVPTLHDSETPEPNVFHSRDNSYLRLKFLANTEQIEAGDGTIYTFNSGGTLTRVEDRFGNALDISVSATRWDLSDTQGRTHTVYFSADGKRVESIDLAAFGNTHATYDLVYPDQPVEVQRGCYQNDPELSQTTPAYLLTALRQPDGSEYSMPVSDYHTGFECDLSGRLKQVTLPTRGRVAWEWGGLVFPLENPEQDCAPEGGICATLWRSGVTGVHRRILYDASGIEVGRWTYESFLDNYEVTQEAHELRNRITTPLGDYTDHFFSVKGGSAADPPWDFGEFGLPFTKNESDGAGRYLSTREYNSANQLLRRTYVRYEHDQGAVSFGNRRLASTRTIYDDGRFADSTSSDFDGYGNYRRTVTDGNFGSGDVRTSFRRFNKDRGTYGQQSFHPLLVGEEWILDILDLSWEQEGANVAIHSYNFDALTGWLRRERIHRLTATTPPSEPTEWQSQNDVIVERVPLGGNPSSERWYGGDTKTVPTGTLGDISLSTPSYRIDSTYQYGSLATTQYIDQNATPLTFKTLDLTIDSSTGLPSSSRDTSLIETAYEYDPMGRLKWVKPQTGDEGWTEYRYTPASGFGGQAKVEVFHRPNGSPEGTALAESVFLYDGLGRLTDEQQRMPSGTLSTRRTLYNAMGWKTSVSELGNVDKQTQYLGYDAFGRPGSVVAPDGHAITFTYTGVQTVKRSVKVGTSFSNQGVHEDPAETTEIYDRQGRLYQVLEPADGGKTTTTTYGYDVGGRLASVTQKNNAGTTTQERFFNYDQRGFLLSEQHPEKGGAGGNGYTFYQGYDARGHAEHRYDCAAQTCSQVGHENERTAHLQFAFDPAERPTTVNQVSVGATKFFKSFEYGDSNAPGVRDNGKLRKAIRWNYAHVGITDFQFRVIESYGYGGKGGRVSNRNTLLHRDAPAPAGDTQQFSTSWVSDELGNVSQIIYPLCTAGPCFGLDNPRTVTNGYTQGRLTGITSTGGVSYAKFIGYYANGTLKNVGYGNDVTYTVGLDPDSMARPASFSTSGASSNWKSGKYSYDGAGNVTGIGTSRFAYDLVSRLTAADVAAPTFNGIFADDFETGDTRCWAPGSCVFSNQTFAQSFTYDPFGNLTSIIGSPGRSTNTNPATNRLVNATYDAAGNMLTWNENGYEYDALGMMTRRCTSSDCKSGEDWRYLYTSNDERFWSTRVTPGQSDSIWTLRDLDGKTLREYDGHLAWKARDYIYRDGQLLASNYQGEGDRFFSLDHLGTPRLITGAQGAKISFHAYSAFGEELTSAAQDVEHRKMTGHERDTLGTAGVEDDQDYMHARYYESLIGRFLSSDSVLDAKRAMRRPQSWNRYSYVHDNPTGFTDPRGRQESAVYRIDAEIHDFQTQGIQPSWRDPTLSSGAMMAVTVLPPLDGAVVLELAGRAAVPVAKFAGPALARVLGEAGETAVRAIYDIGAKLRVAVPGTERFRVPDGLTATTLAEVKNVARLSLTRQLRDFVAIAQETGRLFELYVRPSTRLSAGLQQAVAQGIITLRYIPGVP